MRKRESEKARKLARSLQRAGRRFERPCHHVPLFVIDKISKFLVRPIHVAVTGTAARFSDLVNGPDLRRAAVERLFD